MLRFFAFIVAIALAPDIAHAQKPVPRTAEEIADSTEIAKLSHRLTHDAQSDSARAGRLYEWVARNISYDVQGFLAGRLGDGAAEDVYRKRRAVCGGYVALFERLAREAGLETMAILGYAKGFTYRDGVSTKKPNHSWLAVRVGGAWRLVDPTWASGHVDGLTFVPKFTWDYFLVDPNALILSHFPEENEWQLLPRPVRRSDFQKLPLVPRNVVNAGFDPAMIRTIALADGLRSFPRVGPHDNVRIINAPLNGTLPRESKVSIDVSWPGAADVAVVSGGVWRHLVREGDRFRGDAIATEKAVFLVGRSEKSKEFETLLQYDVR